MHQIPAISVQILEHHHGAVGFLARLFPKHHAPAAYFRDSVGPALKQQEGFLNSRFLTNASTHQCLMVTLWSSEAARTAAETNGFLQDVLKNMKDYFAGTPTIDYYEVGVQVV